MMRAASLKPGAPTSDLPAPGRRRRLLGAAMLTAGIFAIDAFTGLAGGVATLYVLPMLLVAPDPHAAALRAFALLTLVLTLVAFVIGHAAGPGLDALTRLGVSLCAILASWEMLRRRRAASAALAISERRWRGVFAGIATPILEYDLRPLADLGPGPHAPAALEEARRACTLLAVNPAAARLFMAPGAEAAPPGLAVFPALPADALSRCVRALQAAPPAAPGTGGVAPRPAARAEAAELRAALTLPDAAGRPRELELRFTLAHGALPDRAPCTLTDLTDRRAQARAAAEARAEAERAARALLVGQAAASVAHELTQPLAAVRGYARALHRWMDRDPPEIGEAMAALGGLQDAVARAEEVIRSVRAVTGAGGFRPEPLRLGALMEEAAETARSEHPHEAAPIRIAARDGAAGAAIQGDPVLLRRVLANLIQNAEQAMAPTRAACAPVRLHAEIDGGRALIHVEDDGPGFPPERLAHPFAPFRSTRAEGMGVGLAFCRAVAEAHGGRLELSNPETGGARATLSLPL